MSRYHAIPQTVFFSGPGRRSTPRISWKVVDVEAGINERAFPRKTVASCNDELTARRIADMMNSDIPDGRDTNISAAEVVKLIGERGRAQDERDYWKKSYQSVFDSMKAVSARADDLQRKYDEMVLTAARAQTELDFAKRDAQATKVGQPGHAFSCAIVERNRLAEELARALDDRRVFLERLNMFEARITELSKL